MVSASKCARTARRWSWSPAAGGGQRQRCLRAAGEFEYELAGEEPSRGRCLAVGEVAGRSPVSHPVAAYDPRGGEELCSWKDPGFVPVGVEGNRLVGTVRKNQIQHLLSGDVRTVHRTDKGAIAPVHKAVELGTMVSAGIGAQRMYLTQETTDHRRYLTAYELPS